MSVPGFYELTDGSGNDVLYDPAGPTLCYGPLASLRCFSGTEVSTLSSPLGSLVTVTLFQLLGFRRTLTLVVPTVNCGSAPGSHPLDTIAIFTTDRSVFPFPIVGQLQFNSVVPLSGSVICV
jgi:hypothetical protein